MEESRQYQETVDADTFHPRDPDAADRAEAPGPGAAPLPLPAPQAGGSGQGVQLGQAVQMDHLGPMVRADLLLCSCRPTAGCSLRSAACLRCAWSARAPPTPPAPPGLPAGPQVVGEDGSLSRIANWGKLTEREREVRCAALLIFSSFHLHFFTGTFL